MGEIGDKLLGVGLGLPGLDVVLPADMLAHDLASGVRPSAACQMAVATSLSVKKVESAEFMIIISPARMRAAIAELRAM